MPQSAGRAAHPRPANDRSSLYEDITSKIIAELEAGCFPWVQPWGSSGVRAPLGFPKNATTGRRYSGINVLILWSAVVEDGYSVQSWLTFKQALALGGHVRKGERGTTVVYADRFVPDNERQRAHERGGAPRAIPFLKRFTVFNVEQCQDAPCRREKGVIRNDLGKPKLSYVHQSHRMPKGSRDHSMTGARP
jgi:antirestriction protein ArdC